MNQSRHPLRFNVGFVISQPIGTNRELHFDIPQLNLSSDINLTGVQGTVRLGRTPQGILLQANFQALSEMECVRCLAVYQQSLHANFNELYAFNRRSVTESGLILPEDANIDIAPLLHEYIILDIPIRPLCRPDCKGLCTICGEDLNTSTCEHQAIREKSV